MLYTTSQAHQLIGAQGEPDGKQGGFVPETPSCVCDSGRAERQPRNDEFVPPPFILPAFLLRLPARPETTSRAANPAPMPLNITPIPFARDNYIWMLDDGHYAVLVDPGEAGPALAVLEQRSLTPAAILLTHHHADHTGGVAAIAARFAHAPLPVYGPAKEAIAGVTHPLAGDDSVSIPALGLDFLVLDVAAHTRGHVAYLCQEKLFCGDALFSAGCGRLFEGTPADLLRALDRLARLPPATQVYCAHEYTLANLAFARAAEPDNAERKRYAAQCAARRAQREPTLPSTIAIERAINPFLRCDEKSVRHALIAHTGIHLPDRLACLTALRAWKDVFQA
jgi:hydroxyacylglutathione hydrolase